MRSSLCTRRIPSSFRCFWFLNSNSTWCCMSQAWRRIASQLCLPWVWFRGEVWCCYQRIQKNSRTALGCILIILTSSAHKLENRFMTLLMQASCRNHSLHPPAMINNSEVLEISTMRNGSKQERCLNVAWQHYNINVTDPKQIHHFFSIEILNSIASHLLHTSSKRTTSQNSRPQSCYPGSLEPKNPLHALHLRHLTTIGASQIWV